MINTGAMKSSSVSRGHRTDVGQRAKVLAAFERSGLSGAAFARQQGIKYSTFCAWRQQQVKASPGFVQVDLATTQAGGELVLELGPAVRMRLNSAAQVAL